MSKRKDVYRAEFVNKTCRVLDDCLGPRTCTVGTVIGSSLPIAMIVMGAIHLDNCPAERYIPIYLIVSGCFSIALAVFMVIGTWMQDEDGKIPKALSIPSVVMGLFLFAWLIAGSVWIYRIYNKYDPDNVLAPNYCDNTFYLFAFWVTTVVYILISLIVCCISIVLLVTGIYVWMCIVGK